MSKIDRRNDLSRSFLKGSSGSKRNTRTSSQRAKGSRASSAQASSSPAFDQLLSESELSTQTVLNEDGSINESKLSYLQDRIHQSGQQLLAKPGIDAVLDYKEKVQDLLRSVHPLLHDKEQITSHKRMGNSVQERRFLLVHTVNKKLDGLLRMILQTQHEQLEILKAMDEIRGLIVDILR